MAGALDLKVPHEQTFLTNFTIRECDSTNVCAARDLTDATEISMQVRKKPGSTVLLEATLTNGKIAIVGDPANGTFSVFFSDSEITPIPPGKYFYNIILSESAAQVVIVQGAFIITPSITVV